MQRHWISGLCPSSIILKNKTMFRKLDLFPSSGERRETPTLLGSLERANLNHCETHVEVEVAVEFKLRPTVSRPVRLGFGLPSGAHYQIFVFCLAIAGFLMWHALSDERTGM
jgi:hypothetical protein